MPQTSKPPRALWQRLSRDRLKGASVLKTRRLSVHHLLPGLSLAVTLFIFAPVDLYLTSAGDLWFGLEDILPWLGLLALAAFAAVTLLSRFLPQKLSVAFRAAVYAASFLLYLQGNLLVVDYGTLNGDEVNWSAYTLQYVLDALLWVAVVVLFIFLMFRFRKKFRRIVEVAACVLLVTQAVSLSVFLVRHYTAPQPEDSKRFVSVKNEFTVSPESNTVVFLLDAFDTHLFEDVRQKYPERISGDFEDFTYFPDTVGGATRTKFAIPFILGGFTNRDELSYLDYRKTVYDESPLIRELSAGAYDSGFYTSSFYIDMSRDDAVGNIVVGRPLPSSGPGLTKQFMKLVAFRYAPSVLSRYFWMYTGDFDYWKGYVNGIAPYKTDDAKFYQELTSKRLKASAEKPAFRFYHLKGAHTPFTLTENCKRVALGKSDEERQVLGVLSIVREYLSQLKALGLYDRTTVIVMADHGYVVHSTAEQTPLFMVKFAGASHPFEVSDMPFSYTALPEVMTSALRGELASLELYRASSPRYFYRLTEKNADVHLTEYVIDGPALEAEPVKTGVVLYENAAHLSRDYTPGTVLYFDERNTARRFLVSGFARNEATHTWTSGYDAEMLFDLPEPPGALVLEMKHSTSNGAQTVEVFVNDRLIETYVADGSTDKSVLIPAGTVAGTELRLRLHLPDAVSPLSLGKSNGDKRILALKMKTLVISPAADAAEE